MGVNYYEKKILESLNEQSQPISAKQLSKIVKMGSGTVYKYLYQLEHRGIVTRISLSYKNDKDSKWRISIKRNCEECGEPFHEHDPNEEQEHKGVNYALCRTCINYAESFE